MSFPRESGPSETHLPRPTDLGRKGAEVSIRETGTLARFFDGKVAEIERAQRSVFAEEQSPSILILA